MHTWPNFAFTVAYVGSGGALSLTPLAGAIAFTGYAPTVASSGSTITIPAAASIASRSSGKELLSVYFDASGTTHSTITDPEHELFYAWDFGDDVSETWAYGTDTTRNKNVAYGPQAAHVYKTAGTKTWTLVVIDGSGGTETRTGTITVSAWTEAETIYIANGSTPTAGANGVGSGALGYYNETTASGMLSKITANPGKRILLDRASTWSPTGNTTLSGHTGTHIGSYGAGSVATFTPAITATYTSMLTIPDTCSDIRLSELKFNATVVDVVGATAIYADCDNLLLHKCEITGSHEGIDGVGNDGVFFDSCNFHDIGVGNTSAVNGTFYYGAFMSQTTRLAVMGTAIDNVWTGHCMRLHPTNRVCIHNSTIRKARRGYGTGNGHALTIRGPENSGTWGGVWTEKIVVRDCIIGDTDDGLEPLQVAPENTGMATRHRNVVIENNRITSRINSGIISEVCSRLTVRGNIFKTSGGSSGITLSYQNAVGTPASSDVKIYNNTFYKPDTTIANGFSAINCDAGTSGTLIANNLAYAPGDTRNGLSSTADGDQSTFICGDGSYTLVGGNSSNYRVKNVRPWAATTPSVDSDYAPNGADVDGGVPVPVMKDFFNATIVSPRDIGAIQV